MRLMRGIACKVFFDKLPRFLSGNTDVFCQTEIADAVDDAEVDCLG